MKNFIVEYKGYKCRFTYDQSNETYFGRVINIQDMITTHCDNFDDTTNYAINSIDDYLEFCRELGEQPEQPKGHDHGN